MIKFNNVTYKINDKIILSNITFEINRFEKVLIHGKSGSGKTTIFNLLVKHIKPTNGQILFNNIDINTFSYSKLLDYRKNKISLISQEDDLFIDKTVLENLLIFYEEKDIIDILNKTKLYHYKDRLISSLSGGERQRIAIVKELLANTEVILCDEITSALDSITSKEILKFIIDNFNDKTIIFISHDVSMFKDYVDRMLHISNGKLISYTLYKIATSNHKVIKTNKRKNELITFLKQSKRSFNISFMLVYLVSIICLYICFNFISICEYCAYASYSKYFNYDVVSICDNTTLKEDNVTIYKDISNELSSYQIFINDIVVINKNILPFNNQDNYSPLVINQMLLDRLNINKIDKIRISINKTNYVFNDIDIVNEDNMFTFPTIYYDFKYFNKLININTNQLLMIVDNFTLDDRFTNNPMFIDKKEDKPYIDSLAYQDYLTYKMIFDSIKDIVNYYVIITSLYCFVISILINYCIITKDSKKIAIYISKGFKDISILSNYLIPIISFSLAICILFVFIDKLFIPFIISFVFQVISIVISYYIIKKKSLYKVLKQEYLV